MNGQSADVVIIGGGARGTSIAYHLAMAGASVTLLERHGLASATSGATNAYIGASAKPPGFYTELSFESVRLYHGLEDELGEDLEFLPVGYIGAVIEHESEFRAAYWHADRQNRVPGMKVEVVTGDGVRELEPALAPHVLGVSYASQDCNINPFKLVAAYGRAASRLGARIMTYTKATAIKVEQDRVVGVETDRGTIATAKVVNAAGAWVPTVGSWVGLTIPVATTRGQMITTEKLPKLINRPIGAVRQLRDGTVNIGTTDELIGHDKRVTLGGITGCVTRAVRWLPALKDVWAIRCWAGLRPMPLDGLPIMGEAPRPRGFYIATGHSGMTLAQVTGKIMAELLTTGRSYWPLEDYDLLRFFKGQGPLLEAYQYYRARHPLPAC